MSRFSRTAVRASLATLVLALAACEGIPTLTGPSLTGEISGKVSPKTKIAITDTVPYDFSKATVLAVSNGKYAYALPETSSNLALAAFEDEDGDNRWDPGEPISYECTSCSYLRLTKVGTTWKVFEVIGGTSQASSLDDSNIDFNA